MTAGRSLLLALLVGGSLPTSAPGADSLARCDADRAERIRFIEDRLERRRTYAEWWWKGWVSAYGIGAVVEGVRAGVEDDTSRKADYAVTAAKAAFGSARLLVRPPSARVGADPMRAIEPVDDAACRERLAVGERLLRQNAKESESRWNWKRHVANVAINVAGGLVVAEGFGDDHGWTSAGVGIAVGEAMTFSHPWRSDDDLADYERRFDGAPPPSSVTISIAPWRQGAALRVGF